MARVAAKQARTSIGAIHAVVGSDEAEVKRVARELAQRLTPPEGGEFGLDLIDGCAESADDASSRIHRTIEALLTVPFFGGRKLVWLKNANFLGDTVTGRAASVTDTLTKLTDLLTAGLPADVTFLISVPEIDKRRSFYKTLSKLAAVAVHDRVDASRSGWEEEATAVVRTRANGRGLRMTEDAVDLLVRLTGGEGRQIDNELEKLDLFLGTERRDVTATDVRLVVPLTRAGVIFELGNALARRDLPGCLRLVDQLLSQGESAVGILLVAIAPTVRNLLLAKDLLTHHRLARPQAPFHFTGALNRLPPEATAHLPRKKDGTVNTFALGLAAVHAHRYELPELRRLFTACVDANMQIVSTSLEARVVLTQLLALAAVPEAMAKRG